MWELRLHALESEPATLIGMIGLYRDQRAKRSHKAWIWGMFVAEWYRGTGAGRALLEEAIRAARSVPGLRRFTSRYQSPRNQPGAST